MRIRRRWVGGAAVIAAWLLLLAALPALAGCGPDGGNSGPTEPPGDPPRAATPADANAEGTPLAADDGPPSVDRILQHIQYLAGDLGPRVAGTEAEREAARYIAGVLQDAGYEAAIEPFTFVHHYDDSKVVLPDGAVASAFMLDGSATGEVTGRAVFGGMGQADELAGLDLAGRVLVLDRGLIPFEVKARNAEEAGAIAVVIVNHDERRYFGMLGEHRASIPVVGTSLTQRDALREAAERGEELRVTAAGGQQEQESQNVVGRNGQTCQAYLGAHYDSVPESPGANDNASGTAMMLELARAYPVDGLCVIAFGAEEVGLWGSRAYVVENLQDPTWFMLNLDMVGKVTNPIIVGDDELTEQIMRILRPLGDSPLRAGSFPPFASSDHRSFMSAGIPAVTIHSGDDEHIHSPEDDLENVDAESLEVMLRSSEFALLGLLRSYGMSE